MEQMRQQPNRVPGKAGGHLFLRNKTWHCAFSLRGREIRKSTKCSDLKAAQKFLEAEMRKVHADRANIKTYTGDPKIERIRVNELLDDMVTDYCRNRGGAPRAVSQQMASKLRIVRAHFGDFRVVDLRRHHIETFIDSLRAQKKTPAYTNRLMELVHRALVLAVKADPPKAMRVIEIEKQDERGNARKGKFNRHEAELIFLNAPEWLSDFFRLLHETGMRAGEASQLRWSYLNADQSVLAVPGDICKNRESRIVAVTPTMTEILERRRLARIPGCDLIFYRKGGKRITARSYNPTWHRLAVLTGLGKYVCRIDGATLDAMKVCPKCGKSGGYYPKFVGKTPHDFRRTACHEMEMAGVPRDIAKEVSGHRSDAMYLRYADLFSDAQRAERQLQAQARRAEFMATVAQSDKTPGKMSGVECKMLN